MNCKPGDLAIYVGHNSPNDVGMIVQVICFLGEQLTFSGSMAPMWMVDPPLKHTPATRKCWVADSALIPIRPDETPEESIEAMKKLHDLEKDKV